MKHSVPKGDKRKKKEVTLEIARLEEELKERFKRELEELSGKHLPVSGFSSSCCFFENAGDEMHFKEVKLT